jgi:OOP family OmpA-OmpF porin
MPSRHIMLAGLKFMVKVLWNHHKIPSTRRCRQFFNFGSPQDEGKTMKIYTKILAVVVAAGLLAACGSTDQVASMKVKGGAFATGLHSGYVKLADEEYVQSDMDSGDAYVGRAKSSAMGKPPGPEAISARKLMAPHKGQLTKARARMVSAFGKSATKKVPGDAARAQTSFDCWMEQAEENIQPKDIAACRKAFMGALKKVEASVATKMAKKMMKMKKKKKKKARKPGTTQFVVYFDFNSSKLSKTGKAAVDFINGEMKKGAKVSLSAFADRSGSADYNNILATKRAKTVYSALNKSKIKGDITMKVLGEEQNAVATKDGVKQNLNRRVEIFVFQ